MKAFAILMLMNQHHFATKQTRELYETLSRKGLKVIEEYSDGHKHVDIAIPQARIYIEVDGLQHFTDPAQIERDFKRDHYSDGDDFDTIHIPNLILEHHLEGVSEAIKSVALSRISQ